MEKLKLLVNHIKQHKERTLILFLLSIGLFYAGLTTSPYLFTPTLLCIYLGYVASQIKRIENISQIVDEALKLSKQGDASEFLFAHAVMLNLFIPSTITAYVGLLPFTFITAIGSVLISINATSEKRYYLDILKKLKENDPSTTHLVLGEYHNTKTLQAELSDALQENYTLTSCTLNKGTRGMFDFSIHMLLDAHCKKNRVAKKGIHGLHFFSSIVSQEERKLNEDVVRLVGAFLIAESPKKIKLTNDVITQAGQRESRNCNDAYHVTSEKTTQPTL